MILQLIWLGNKAGAKVLFPPAKSTFYVHLWKKPISNTIQLKPIKVLPSRATLLNDHISQESFLRLRNLQVEEFYDEVLVIKLEFDGGFEEPRA
jgi:hypothetical protein